MKLFSFLLLITVSSTVLAANTYQQVTAISGSYSQVTNPVSAACMGVRAIPNNNQAKIDAMVACAPLAIQATNGWYDRYTMGVGSSTASHTYYIKRILEGTPLQPIVNFTWSAVLTCPAGQEFNETTGQCETPGPICQTGIEIIGNAPLSGNACLDGCSYETSGGILRDDLMHGVWTSTGQTCTEGNVTETTDICITVNGEQLCLDVQQTNCGTFNGSNICVDSIPPGNCALLPGGSYICESTSDSPPAPNSGTPGEVAAPDAQVVIPGGGTVDYYSETKVSGSTGLADSTGVQYGSGTADPGNAGDGGDGGGDDDGGIPTGPGDFGSLGDRMGEVRTITESGDALMEALTGPGSVYAQVQNMQVDAPVGQCPTITVPYFDNVTMDIHCTIFDEVKPVLAVVFQLIWVIVGILIVLSA